MSLFSGSVFEEFYILFKSNASEVKQGYDALERSTKKTQASLKESDHLSKKLGETFKDLASELGKNVLAFLSARSLVEGLAHAKQYAASIHDISVELNANVEDLDAWGAAVKKTGGTFEGFVGTIRGLDRALAQVATTGNHEIVHWLHTVGISVRDSKNQIKDVFSLLRDINVAFNNGRLDRQQTKQLGLLIGADIGTIQFLQKTTKEFDAMIAHERALGTLSKENAQKAKQFNNQWEDTARVFRKVFENVNDALLPVLNRFLQILSKIGLYFQNNPKMIIGALAGIGIAITRTLLPAFARLSLLFLRLIPGAAIILGIGTAVGYLADKMVKTGAWETSLKDLSELWEDIHGWIAKIISALDTASQKVKDFFNSSKQGSLFDQITGAKPGDNKKPSTYFDYLLFSHDASKSWNTSFDDYKKALTESNQISNAMPASSVVNNRNNNGKNVSVSTGDINIHTQATDVDGIAQAGAKAITDHMRAAVNQYNNGVVA